MMVRYGSLNVSSIALIALMIPASSILLEQPTESTRKCNALFLVLRLLHEMPGGGGT